MGRVTNSGAPGGTREPIGQVRRQLVNTSGGRGHRVDFDLTELSVRDLLGAYARIPEELRALLGRFLPVVLLVGGAGIRDVRDTLGHASLATASRYLHAQPGDSFALYPTPV